MAKARAGRPIKPPNFQPNADTLFADDNSGMYPKLHRATQEKQAWQQRYNYWHTLVRAITATSEMAFRSWTGSYFPVSKKPNKIKMRH